MPLRMPFETAIQNEGSDKSAIAGRAGPFEGLSSYLKALPEVADLSFW